MQPDDDHRRAPLLFPLFIDLKGLPTLLVGGAGEAEDKATALVQAGAQLRVVESQSYPWLEGMAQCGALQWISEPFLEKHLEGVWLVVSAVDDRRFNAALAELAEKKKLFLNVVDQPEFCRVQWPARVIRPPVQVAISSGGSSPALARWLKEKIIEILPKDVEALACWLAEKRRFVGEKIPDFSGKASFWRQAFALDVVAVFSESRQRADDLITALLKKRRLK
ncbi:precorrin-2 dehydrogenase/sirohydrochlorin ferrochelatase family protein [Magnetococcales bacterium HHB-1]